MNKWVKQTRTFRSIGALALACGLMAIMATTAMANPTVSVDGNNALSVQGGSEASTLTVSFSGGNYIVTRSSGSLISGGSPCILTTSSKVTCAMGGSTPSSYQVNLGGGNDSITFNNTLPTDATAVVVGAGVVTSQSVPLDATIDEQRSSVSATGGPLPDNINVQLPGTCTANVNGGAGDDQIRVNVDGNAGGGSCGSSPTDSSATGGDGDDMINVEESAVNFTYNASGGHDVFTGGSGHDHITVGDGPDWATGGPGNDRFYDTGGSDPSKLWGGPGTDTYTDWDSGEADITFFDGGSGFDQVAYHNIIDTYDVVVSLDGVANDGVGAEYDNIHKSVEGIGTDETYNASGQFRGNDIMIGSEGPNRLHGRNGNDELHGGGGNDIIEGGMGEDTAYCGDGYDITYGVEGNDGSCEENH